MATKPVTEALREAVENSEDTRYRIAKETGISEANLCRLVQGTRGLSWENLDILCRYLGLELVKSKQASKPRKR